MIDLSKLAAELHEAAVAKGFWAVEKAEIKHIAKMHSELSEAVQEDRCGLPLLYADDIDMSESVTDIRRFDGRKPEGVAAELADFVMMTLDFCMQVNLDPGKLLEGISFGEYKSEMYVESQSLILPELVLLLHRAIDDLTYPDDIKTLGGSLLAIIYGVALWLEIRGFDLWEVIRLKMEYNKSRPALHGRLY